MSRHATNATAAPRGALSLLRRFIRASRATRDPCESERRAEPAASYVSAERTIRRRRRGAEPLGRHGLRFVYLPVVGQLVGCATPCTVVPAVPRFVQLAPPAEGVGFPYQFVDDYKGPRYAYFRAEGRGANVILDSVACGVDYLEKYTKKKGGAPSAEISYFERQTKVAEALGTEDDDRGVKVGFVGDIMWIRNNWNDFLGDDVRRAMDSADFWLGNLETVISKSNPVPSFFPDYANYNSDPGLLRSFRRATGGSYFAALSIANNHALDFRDQGARETIEFLDGERILHNGLSNGAGPRSYTAFMVKGLTFGFYAATWGVNDAAALRASTLTLNVIGGFAPERGICDVDTYGVERALAEMKSDGVDVKIVSLHWGNEFEMYPDPLEVLVARRIVKSGADVIMGAHPHVEQPLEVCVDGEIAASAISDVHPAGHRLRRRRAAARATSGPNAHQTDRPGRPARAANSQ
jgi:Bacterial capsule synthesis protein PGA_cap